MDHTKKRKVYTVSQAYIKISSFCAYQERTQNEVRSKLYEYWLKRDEVEELIAKLITDNFLNEERFAKAYAGGKFRIKKWGRAKIQYALEARGLSRYCVQAGLSEIPDDEYMQTLQEVLEKKWKEISVTNPLQKKYKVATYLLSRGYEQDLVWSLLNEEKK